MPPNTLFFKERISLYQRFSKIFNVKTPEGEEENWKILQESSSSSEKMQQRVLSFWLIPLLFSNCCNKTFSSRTRTCCNGHDKNMLWLPCSSLLGILKHFLRINGLASHHSNEAFLYRKGNRGKVGQIHHWCHFIYFSGFRTGMILGKRDNWLLQDHTGSLWESKQQNPNSLVFNPRL